MSLPKNTPPDLGHLLPVLDNKLMELLPTLTPEEWHAPTVARLWKVKDVVAHLLDGNIRILSMLRDGYQGLTPEIHSSQDLLNFLNQLNADWVRAMQRVSPEMLVLLHGITGKMFCDYYATLDPFATSPFAVTWVGEEVSTNRMHIAREYTEKWLHQQQIREAVNKPGLLTRELFYPFIGTFMMALPHTFRDVDAPEGTSVQITISSEIGGSWVVTREEGRWILSQKNILNPTTQLTLEPDLAWKLFSKSIRPEAILSRVNIIGDQTLAEKALSMVSVMA